MTILLTVLLMLAILIAFMLFLALITKKEYVVEREITINKPNQEVFDYLKLVKNQEKYNVWVMKDPKVKIEYKGIDGTEGFVSAWEGNKQAGKGEQEIVSLIDGQLIKLELRFEKPFKNIGQTYLITHAVSENETKVEWKMTGNNKFPLNLMNLAIDSLLGKDLQQSLQNLKKLLENRK